MGETNRQRKASGNATSLPGRSAESERRQGMRALGVTISRLAAPIVAARGGGALVRLKAEWRAIVGRDWAEVTWPSALGRDGVLRLRTTSVAALELQHRAPLIIERINLFFGRQIVTRLALVQGPLPLAPAPGRPPIRPLSPRQAEALDSQLSGVSDRELRAALARLGRAMAGREH
jgi:hypothetical protein